MNWTVFWVVLLFGPVAAILASAILCWTLGVWYALGETARERVLGAAKIAFCALCLVMVAAIWGALWDGSGVP